MYKVIVYTDGSSIPQDARKPGGYGAVIKYGEHVRTISGAQLHTTSQRMELTALIEALRILKCPCEVLVNTDSQYVMKCAVGEFKINANTPLWKELDSIVEQGQHKLYFNKVAAHTGVELNEACDRLAKKAVEEMLKGSACV